MRDCLRRRNMYDWRVSHKNDFSSAAAHVERRTAEWYGVTPENWAENSDDIMAEYKCGLRRSRCSTRTRVRA
jgi:hypothetical protein